ncbi:hypothetical protein [Tetragenococcus halophilus]|uniref:hypothetical protein n=1 Tax=Tetragenococcus halophilus TaxID=51669 RepID=UPI0015BB148D|nr:hypothetical protein [Tetragenococcus halophilus]NWO00839.1 hypothetical protein [Tetragenococcus halophilus]
MNTTMERNYAKGGIVFTETGSIGGGNYGKVREQFIKAELEKLDDKKRNYEQELKELRQLYYLKVTDDGWGYLNLHLNEEVWKVTTKEEINAYQTRFTKEEIMDMNEGLWSIAVPVEEDDRQC